MLKHLNYIITTGLCGELSGDGERSEKLSFVRKNS
jgi:hypothetical protein